MQYDRSSKWLIEHYGRRLLHLAGVGNVTSCRAAHSNLALPMQMPDSLLEVRLAGLAHSVWFIVEIATYPDRRINEQVLRDAMLVFLDRHAVPEVVTLVLHPKGTYRVPGTATVANRLGHTQCRLDWRVIELWTLPAEQLLNAGDVGLIPWVPLAAYDGPPERLLHQCRARLDAQAPALEKGNLLAVTQILMRLRYNDPSLFAIFGGPRAMIESPLLKEIIEEVEQESSRKATQKALQRSILRILGKRLGPLPAEASGAVQGVTDEARLDQLLDAALSCPDLETFLGHIG